MYSKGGTMTKNSNATGTALRSASGLDSEYSPKPRLTTDMSA